MFSEYNDDGGKPLGHWETITRGEYRHILREHGEGDPSKGSDLIVFKLHKNPGRRVHTEWGIRGETTPLIACMYYPEFDDGDYARFVPAAKVAEEVSG